MSGEDGTNATILKKTGTCSAGDPVIARVLEGGQGGTNLAGGAGGLGDPSPELDGNPASAGGQGKAGGGSGGKGFFGGGGGGGFKHWDSYNGNRYLTGAGGGGAASAIGTDASILSSAQYAGTGAVPGNAGDPDRSLLGPDPDGRLPGDGGVFVTVPGGSKDLGKSGRVVLRMRSSPPVPPLELTHGYRVTETLVAAASPEKVYQIRQAPYASYEVLVDALSGDISNPSVTPLRLERADLWGSVLQSATAAGLGPNQSLRWRNTSDGPVSDHLVRVASTTCTTGCGPDDQFRIRAYETTYMIPSFDNTTTGSDTRWTSVVLQNTTASSVESTLYFWAPNGALLHEEPLTLAAKSVQVFATWTVVPGLSGSVTVANDAPYGRLSGRATTIESPSGLAIDTMMVPRRR